MNQSTNKISRRSTVKGLAAAGLALGTGLGASGISNTVEAAAPAGTHINQDAEILRLSTKIQAQLNVRTQANIALGDYYGYDDGQGQFRDHMAEREALDARIKGDVAKLRDMKPTSEAAMQQRYLAFNNAYFTVWHTMGANMVM